MQADTKIIILVGAIMITSKTQFTPRAGQALVNEFYNSKLKGSTFCKQKNIPYHILQYWRDKCKSIPRASNAKFLPVTMPATITNAYKLKITVNTKITVELPVEIDSLQLKKILEVCVACG
jgi:hypothetical protein